MKEQKPRSIKQTGCPPKSKVIGFNDVNSGLLLVLLDGLFKGHDGCVEGRVRILALGNSSAAAELKEFQNRVVSVQEIITWANVNNNPEISESFKSDTLRLNGLWENESRPKVFICHASGDKDSAKTMFQRLGESGFNPWLDSEMLLPGQDWDREIRRALQESHAVVVLLSNDSISKEGYVQREIKIALDISDEKPQGTIFILPALLEECKVPDRLNKWQFAKLYEDEGEVLLKRALQHRAEQLGVWVGKVTPWNPGDNPLQAKLDQMNQEEVRAWLKCVMGVDNMFNEERDKAWPKIYNYAWEVWEDLDFDW